jgi:small subunit ribosomal protein S16
MLKIRLKRVGRKHDPSFRVVVTESTKGVKSNKYIEMLGSYDPRSDRKDIKADRAKYWIDNGAQASDTVHNLLVDAGVIKSKKINVLPQKSPIKSESAEPEDATAPNETAKPATTEEPATEEPVESPTSEESPTPTEE